jgi:hypothetical protein
MLFLCLMHNTPPYGVEGSSDNAAVGTRAACVWRRMGAAGAGTLCGEHRKRGFPAPFFIVETHSKKPFPAL